MDLVGHHHGRVRQRGLERRGARLGQRRVGGGEDATGSPRTISTGPGVGIVAPSRCPPRAPGRTRPRASSCGAASRNGTQSRRISCARLPGKRPSTRLPGRDAEAARARPRASGTARRSTSGCPTYSLRRPSRPKNGCSNGSTTASRSTAAASRRARSGPPGPELRGDVVQHLGPGRRAPPRPPGGGSRDSRSG